jgi:hypothetical protein
MVGMALTNTPISDCTHHNISTQHAAGNQRAGEMVNCSLHKCEVQTALCVMLVSSCLEGRDHGGDGVDQHTHKGLYICTLHASSAHMRWDIQLQECICADRLLLLVGCRIARDVGGGSIDQHTHQGLHSAQSRHTALRSGQLQECGLYGVCTTRYELQDCKAQVQAAHSAQQAASAQQATSEQMRL